jgi:6-phosphogluconolactonase
MRAEVVEDRIALGSAVAARVVAAAREAVAARGRFRLVLTGGSSPQGAYARLAGYAGADVPWKSTEIFVGDERWVPHDDARSNYGMAKRLLLDLVPVPPANLHPMPTGGASPAADAARYEQTLVAVLANAAGELDPFDLVLLGVGEDGHTASLFPGDPAVDEVRRRVVATHAPAGAESHDRISMTMPTLVHARAILVLCPGKNKAPVLRTIRAGGADAARLPAARLAGLEHATWMVDEDAWGAGAGAH